MTYGYRRDDRTVAQFAADIEHGHRVERDIIDRYAQGREVIDNGVDNTGALIDRPTTDADFIVDGVLIEVKFNNHMLDTFHLKIGQMRSYIKQGATILWVNGYEAEQPRYTIMTPDQLKVLAEESIEVMFWKKQCYRLYATEFEWRNL